MPRPATISYDDFRAAALRLMEAGDTPTFSRLRAELGGGSYDVLRRYLDAFEQEKARRLKTPAVPDDVLGGIQGWYERIRDEASTQARAELNAEFETLAQRRAALEADFARLRDEARDARRDLERFEVGAAALREELAQSRAEGARLAGELAATREELAVERERHLRQVTLADELRAQLKQAAQDAAAGIALADERARSLERTLLQRHDEAAELWKARLRELEVTLGDTREQRARDDARQAEVIKQADAARAAERALHGQALATLEMRQAMAEQDAERVRRELASEREARRTLEAELTTVRTAIVEARSRDALISEVCDEIGRCGATWVESIRSALRTERQGT
ncbi:DNA-binding protein [Derxia gummosa]|uniref:DNA-binding protein n=1 Tax=Derxia gummosa DSM 723 TaxID=1121388 RepID=A0A8B6X5F9_9BURK|nr:DNA-binding protein [Derxia gummosa]